MIDFGCDHDLYKKNGKDENGRQRYKCLRCGLRFRDEKPVGLLGELRIDLPRAELILNMLVEGSSVRTIARITNTDPHTIIDLMLLIGTRCKQYMERRFRAILANHVQVDEVWQFVYCKDKTAKRMGFGERVGDSYLFTAIERDTKLLFCWHLGKRSSQDTETFCAKLARSAFGHFQLSTDAFGAYAGAVIRNLRNRVDYGQVIKIFGPASKEDSRKYSPATIIECTKHQVYGRPKEEDICTSHCERMNLNFRTFTRRMTRLSNGFSKKWKNHEAAVCLFIAHYNFCRVHGTLKTTPAVKHGLENHRWTMRELLENINEA